MEHVLEGSVELQDYRTSVPRFLSSTTETGSKEADAVRCRY